MTPVDLWTAEPPWLHVVPDDAQAAVRDIVPPSGVTVVGRMDATGMADADGVYEQFYDALKLPDYFGWNWPALSDCLRDLNWLPSDRYLLNVENANSVLSGSTEEREVFFDILARAGRHWSSVQAKVGRVGIPFNVLLSCPADEVEALQSEISKFH